jgi:hypothetical protein
VDIVSELNEESHDRTADNCEVCTVTIGPVSVPWIPVGESLPEIGKRVLLCVGGFVLMGHRFERSRWVDIRGEFYARSVTHWAPLPEPPK